MIDRPTTFVIGAGASIPYGLPSGIGLRNEAISLKPENDIYRLVVETYKKSSQQRIAHIPSGDVDAFVAALREHPAESIDEFLEKHPDEKFSRIGRLTIAALMGRALKGAKREPVMNEDWLLHIVRKLNRNVFSFADFILKNQCRFVTFNFDTFIEGRFDALVRSSWPSQADASGKYYPVLHIHGRLFSPPSEEVINPVPLKHVSPRWIEWIEKAADQLRVTADVIEESTLLAAKEAIAQASIVCFLGFGYNRTNLDRLGVLGVLASHQERFGSAYRMSASDRETLKLLVPGIVLAGTNAKCIETLNDLHVIRDV